MTWIFWKDIFHTRRICVWTRREVVDNKLAMVREFFMQLRKQSCQTQYVTWPTKKNFVKNQLTQVEKQEKGMHRTFELDMDNEREKWRKKMTKVDIFINSQSWQRRKNNDRNNANGNQKKTEKIEYIGKKMKDKTVLHSTSDSRGSQPRHYDVW